MLFRWAMEAVFEAVKPLLDERRCGLDIDGSRLTRSCWADGTWLLANTAAELDWMIRALETSRDSASARGHASRPVAATTPCSAPLPTAAICHA